MKCETIPDLEKFLAIQEQALGPRTPEVATTLSKLAELYCADSNWEKAESLFQRAVDIRSQLYGIQREGLEHDEGRLSDVKAARLGPGNPAQTVTASGNQTRPEDVALAPHTEPLISTQSGTIANKSLSSAIPEAELELESLKQMIGADHPSVADVLTKLADLYCRAKMYNKMEPLLAEALKLREAACGPNHPAVATELKNLAALYCVQERYALAEPLLKRAITLRERAYGRMHARVADVEAQYAQLLRKTNRIAQAEALEHHVSDIRSSHDNSLFSCDSSFFGAALNKPRR
jgi:tetratricopeptide (TPR) repeat protein